MKLNDNPGAARAYLERRPHDAATLNLIVRDEMAKTPRVADLGYAQIVAAMRCYVVVPRDVDKAPVWCSDAACAAAYVLARWW